MKIYLKYLLIFLGISLFFTACSRKANSPPSKQDYTGSWKLTDPQGNIYYMTLAPDGSGQTTREGGEFGKWEFKDNHIEATWNPKTMRFYFNSGKIRPLQNPTVDPGGVGPSTGVKVEKIPE